MKVLAGDLGGTKALLGIAEITDGRPHFLFVQHLACAGFTDCDALLERFRAAAGDALHDVSAACLAVAGPLSENRRSARFTNLPWQVDADDLSAAFGFPLKLVNDFAAVAAGVSVVEAEYLVTLQPGCPVADDVRLAIGAGTGLGVAALASGKTLNILSSEGGHIGFAPASPVQDEFACWLRANQQRATAERAISGTGLVNLYRFMAQKQKPDAPNPLQKTEPAAAIGALALQRADSLARRVVEEFFTCYGAFAGDMAMTYLARGGVFLAGGVSQKLLPILKESQFLTAFNDKAEHAELARSMPVHVITDPAIGLSGAAVLAL